MSRLLINEPALQVLPSLAVKVGLNEAIALQQLHFRLSGGSMRDGRRWYLRALKDWREEFPFWSPKTIQRTFDNLRSLNLVEATDEYNRADRRDLWWTINYEVLEALELGLNTPLRHIEKVAPSADGQNDHAPPTKTGEAAPSADGHFDHAPSPLEEGHGQNDHLSRGGHFDHLSSLKKNVLTTPPPTPSTASSHDVIVGGGAGEEWKDWKEHLGLRGGPAVRLHGDQWAEWIEAGLVEELRAGATAVILMGNKANDPSALLRSRIERIARQREADVARAAEHQAVLNVGAEQIPENSRWTTPKGEILTVDYVADGFVFWRENHAPEAPVGHVLRWQRQDGAA